jgi:NCS1 family nucleobase:cation symporter-1
LAAWQVESHTIEPIPENERHGRPRDLFTLWFAANMQVTTIVTGAVLVAIGLPFLWALVAAVLGNLIGAIFMAYHSAQGPIIGIPQMIQSRAQFGYYGALLPLLLVLVMYIGFYASSAVLGGQALAQLTGLNGTAAIIVVFLVTLVITVGGYDYIHRYQRVMSLIFLVAFLVFTVGLFVAGHVPATAWSGSGFSWGPFILGVTIPVTWQITYAPYVSDYSRYLPKDVGVGATFRPTYWGTVIASVWMMALGALLTVINGHAETVTLIRQFTGSLGALMMLVIIFGIVAANVLNVYGGMLTTETVLGTLGRLRPSAARRLVLVILVGVVGTGIAIWGQGSFLTNYTNFLFFLLYLAIPWTAINLTDFYLVRHGRYDQASFFRPAGYGAVNGAALMAYVVGSLAEIPFINSTFYEGPVAKALGGADISWIIGIAVSAGLYLLFRPRTEPDAGALAP